jgi:hypothetical protein
MKLIKKQILQNIPDGSYRVRITKIETTSGTNDQGEWSGLRIRFEYVSNKYKGFFAPSMMLFFTQDDDGVYIKKGSKHDLNSQSLFGVKDYSSLDHSILLGREYVATVMTKPDDGFTNIIQLFYKPIRLKEPKK